MEVGKGKAGRGTWEGAQGAPMGNRSVCVQKRMNMNKCGWRGLKEAKGQMEVSDRCGRSRGKY